jgi:hypothetical protein
MGHEPWPPLNSQPITPPASASITLAIPKPTSATEPAATPVLSATAN